jgi:hypothetical protein
MSLGAFSCCCRKCPIASDDYDRADGTDIDTGSDAGWTEAAGSWEIASNKLKTTSSNARALCTATDSEDGNVYVTVDVVGANSNDEIIVSPKYKDSSNYYYVRLIIGTSKTLALRKVVAGVDSSIASASIDTTAGTTYSLTVCVGTGPLGGSPTFLAYESVSGATVSTTLSALVGYNGAALATGSITSNVTFDNFVWQQGYNSSNHSDCPVCACTTVDDDFTRANSTDVDTGSPGGWTEVDGDWSIASNKLSISATNAVLKCDTDSPSNDISISLGISSSSVGDKIRIMLSYVDDNNYICGEGTVASGNTGRWKIISRVSGTDTVLRDIRANMSTSDTWVLCYTAATGRLWIGSGSATYTTATYIVGALANKTVAIGTGSIVASSITFNRFKLQLSTPSCSPCPSCPSCSGSTLGTLAMSDTITVTLSSLANSSCGSCATLNGVYHLNLIGGVCGGGLICNATNSTTCAGWEYKFPSTICGMNYLYVGVSTTAPGGPYTIRVLLCDAELGYGPPAKQIAATSANSTPQFDCTSISVACPVTSTTGECATAGLATVATP